MNQQARIAELISSLDPETPNQDQVIEELVSLANEYGLKASNLERLYEVLLGRKSLPVSTALNLSNAIVPREPITSDSILLVVSSLGEEAHNRSTSEGRVEYRLQKRLLQQFVVLYEVGVIDREGINVLRRCYGVLEKGLEYKMLREPIAAVLCQMVEKSHASKTTIERIDHLIRLIPEAPESLLELSRIYHRLESPDDISYEPSAQRKLSLLDKRNKEVLDWSGNVRRIFGSRVTGDGEGRKFKRRKLSHTGNETVVLEELVRDLDRPVKTSIPGEVQAIFDKRPHTTTADWTRIESWKTLLHRGYGQDPECFEPLRSFFSNYYSSHAQGEPKETGRDDSTPAILSCLLSLCEVSGELPEACEAFLAEHFSRWDGISHQESTFALLPYLKPPALELLKSQFLRPLSELSTKSQVGWLAQSIECLSTMMIRWAVRDDWDREVDSATAYGRKRETLVAVAGLQAIVDSVDLIIESAVHRFPDSLELRISAFDFYDKSLDLSLIHDLPVVVVPSPTFAYSALCSDELMSVSRMGGILARLREALTGDKTAIQITDAAYTEPVNAFNARLLEYGNALWKKHFLAPTPPGEEETSHGLSDEHLDQIRLYAEGRDQSVAGALGLTTHGAFSSLATQFLKLLAENEGKNIEGFTGKVSTSALKQLNSNPSSSTFKISFTNFRPLFLEYLQDQGASGLYDCLFSSMQSLIKRRESQRN